MAKVKELGEKKKNVTTDDLPLLIEDLFGQEQVQSPFQLKDARISSSLHGQAEAGIQVKFMGQDYSSQAQGDGGYNAYMNALHKIAEQIGLCLPKLYDYEVSIPPGGKTDALVEATITWKTQDQSVFRTSGVATDQVFAAIYATEKMLWRLLKPTETSQSPG